jgi:hypothetical protein
MNVVIDDAAEVYVNETKPKREIGAQTFHYQILYLHSYTAYYRAHPAQGGQYYANPTGYLRVATVFYLYS